MSLDRLSVLRDMPKELTHWILAERAFAGLDANCPLQGIIDKHHDLYLSGAVLPDTLMHLFHGPQAPTALALAKRFHDTGTNSYAPFIRAEEHFPDGFPTNLLACLLGIIAHMQADIVFHPYVYSLSGVTDIGRHYRLETALDVYFMRRDVSLPARHLRDLVRPGTRDDLVTACSLIFDPSGELPSEIVGHTLDLHCRFQQLYDRTHWKLLVRLLGSLHAPPFKDYQHLFYPLRMTRDNGLLTGHEQWQHPITGELLTTSIDELSRQVVRRTTTVMERIAEHGSLTKALTEPPGENLLTGMYGVKASQMVGAHEKQGKDQVD